MVFQPPRESNIEEIKQIVEKYFRVYESRQEGNFLAFYVEIFEEYFNYKFELLLKELKDRGLIPFIREEKGEYIIFITQKPYTRKKPFIINILLLLATIITTTFMGTILYTSFEEIDTPFLNNILNGFIFFSFPLLSIIGFHESAHYIASKRHGVETTLPYFIPLPVPPLGTLGAVISIKEPIPDRNALLDIGIAGPIAGFLVSIPVLFIGLIRSELVPTEEIKDMISLGEPLLFKFISELTMKSPDGFAIKMHPTAFAGWVGLLVTAINLLPAGQLDGGHIARAVLKGRHRYASVITVLFLAVLTFFGIGNWLLMILLLVFLIGTEHPPPLNEITPLDKKRKILSVIAVLLFILSFAPMPIK